MRRTIRAVAGIAVLLGTLFLTSTTVNAQEECGGYTGVTCPETEVLTFEYPRTVRSGQSILITGDIKDIEPNSRASARASGDTVEFVLVSVTLGSVPVEDDGTFSGTFTVPTVAAGEYEISATSGTLVATGPITVVAGSGVNNGGVNNNNGTSGGTGPLARTGFDSTPMITLGAAIVILGGAAVYGSKRRRLA